MKFFARDTAGASAVEFALIVPVLLSLVFGIVEFSFILYTYNVAEHAALDVTRQLATNQISTSQVSGIASGELPSWIGSSATVSTTSSSTNPSINKYTVLISIPATAASPTNLLSFAYRTLTLKATSTMQQEPTS